MSRLGRRLRHCFLLGSAAAAAWAVAGCGLTEPAPTRRTLDVSAHKEVCTALYFLFCLQVREPGATDWEFMYGHPRGFSFEWGVATRIEVEERRIENPPLDGSDTERTLVRVVAREVLPADSVFTLVVPGGTTHSSEQGLHEFEFGAELILCILGPDCAGLHQSLQGSDATEVTLVLGPTPDAPFRVVAWRGCGLLWPGCPLE